MPPTPLYYHDHPLNPPSSKRPTFPPIKPRVISGKICGPGSTVISPGDLQEEGDRSADRMLGGVDRDGGLIIRAFWGWTGRGPSLGAGGLGRGQVSDYNGPPPLTPLSLPAWECPA